MKNFLGDFLDEKKDVLLYRWFRHSLFSINVPQP